MNISPNIHATRVTGTLEVELEDGRTATLEVDLDVSSPQTTWGVDYEYANEGYPGSLSVSPARRVSTTYSISIPVNLREDESGQFALRIPVSND